MPPHVIEQRVFAGAGMVRFKQKKTKKICWKSQPDVWIEPSISWPLWDALMPRYFACGTVDRISHRIYVFQYILRLQRALQVQCISYHLMFLFCLILKDAVPIGCTRGQRFVASQLRLLARAPLLGYLNAKARKRFEHRACARTSMLVCDATQRWPRLHHLVCELKIPHLGGTTLSPRHCKPAGRKPSTDVSDVTFVSLHEKRLGRRNTFVNAGLQRLDEKRI